MRQYPVLKSRFGVLNWSPDGESIIVGNHDGTTAIYNATTGDVEFQLVGHSEKVNDADYSPDGTRIATVSADGTVRLWNAVTGEEERLLTGHVGPVESVHWSPDGQRIVTGGHDGLPRVWDVTSGEVLFAMQGGHANPINHVYWSSDGRLIATVSAGEGVEKIWDANSGTLLLEVPGTTRGFGGFSPDGTRILTGSLREYSSVFVYDISRLTPRLIGHTTGLEYADWSPDGRLIATSTGSSGDPTVRIWDASTGQQLHAHEVDARYLDWSPDSTRMAIPAFGGVDPYRIEVLDLATQEVTSVLTTEENFEALSARWSPDGRLIAASFWNLNGQRPIYIWDVEADEVLNILYEDCMQWAAEWSPDGTQIVSSCLAFGEPGVNTPARIRDVATGETVQVFESEHGWTLRTLWSPDGERLLVTYEDGAAIIWDVATGEELLTFAGHLGSVWGGDWSPDGHYIVTGDTNGQVKVWNSETGEEVASFSFNGDAVNTKWSPDSTYIIIAGGGSNEPLIKRVWLSTDELIAHAYECCVTRDLTAEERAQFGLPER